MAWLRVESNFPQHRKVHLAGDRLGRAGRGRVLAVWLLGSSYSVAHLTDGFVPNGVMDDLRYDRKPIDVIVAMLEVGLLEATERGYLLHDFHHYNPSAEAVLAKRKVDLERKSRNGKVSEPPRNRAGVVKESNALASMDGRARSESDPESDPETTKERAPTPELFALFDELHQRRFENAAEFDRKKDAGIFASLWRKRGREQAEALIRAFFELRDPWVLERGFSVGIFKSQIPKLLAKLPAVKPREHWSDECQRLHGGSCTRQWDHDGRMQDERAKAAS